MMITMANTHTESSKSSELLLDLLTIEHSEILAVSCNSKSIPPL
jgi:hypothetical protein